MHIPAKILLLFYDLLECSDNIFHIVPIWPVPEDLRRVNGRVDYLKSSRSAISS